MSISLKDFMKAGKLLEFNQTSNIDGGEGPPKTPGAFSKKKKSKGKIKKGKIMKGKVATGEGGHKKPDVFDYTLVEEISKEDLKEIQQIIRDEIEAMTKKGKTIDLGRLGKYIRREQASLFFDLFKKRGVWMT